MSGKCSILVCSCDLYADLWYPFFTLMKIYWPDCPFEVHLNTETILCPDYGVNVQQHPNKNLLQKPYGTRMLYNLENINTAYVMILMDDFFLHRKVKTQDIEQVLQWMETDKNIAVFSFQNVEDKLNIPSEKYPGFSKRPVYGEYKFNFQAAIWRTDLLIKFWRKHETPWQWETLGNYRSFTSKYDFYVLENDRETPIDYGFDLNGMGVFRGKWVAESVVDLFKKNDINVDFTLRGFYKPEDFGHWENTESNVKHELYAIKSLGFANYITILIWRVQRLIRIMRGEKYFSSYIEYKRNYRGEKI